MTTLREAAQQALEALLRVQPQVRGAIPVQDVEDALNALRAALAKPERRYSCPICAGAMTEWQGLTDEEIAEVFGLTGYDTMAIENARAIEAALKERNT